MCLHDLCVLLAMYPLCSQAPGCSFLSYSSVDHCPWCYRSWQKILMGFFCALFAGIQEYSLLTTPQALSHQHRYWASSNAGVLLPGRSQHGSSSIPQSSMGSAHFPESFVVPFTLTDERLWDFQHHSSTIRLNHPRFYLVLVLTSSRKPSQEGSIGSARSVIVLF